MAIGNKTRFDNAMRESDKAAKEQFAEVFSEDTPSLLPEGFDPSKVVAEKSERKASVSITMTPSMKRDLTKLAKQNGFRSMSAYVTKLLDGVIAVSNLHK